MRKHVENDLRNMGSEWRTITVENGVQVSTIDLLKRKLKYSMGPLFAKIALLLAAAYISCIALSQFSFLPYSFIFVPMFKYLDILQWLTSSVKIQRQYPSLLKGRALISSPASQVVSTFTTILKGQGETKIDPMLKEVVQLSEINDSFIQSQEIYRAPQKSFYGDWVQEVKVWMQTQWIYQQREQEATYRQQFLNFDSSNNPNSCITYVLRTSTDSE